MSLGFQHLYTELDDLDLLKRVIQLYFEREMRHQPEQKMLGVLICTPEVRQRVRLPWTIRSQPKAFPLMLIDDAWLAHPDTSYKPWYFLGEEPTYVLRPTTSYSALTQLLHQLDHYLALHASDWDKDWRQVPVPDCDGSIDEGFSVSTGNFGGPLVIGRVYAEYHK